MAPTDSPPSPPVTGTDEVSQRLAFALEISSAAADLILSYYHRPSLEVEFKVDASPVTEADRGAELLLRERILKRFPDDGVLGEEFGEHPGRSGFRWILDPVDGTKAFVHGVPLFGTLIGIEQNGAMVAGLCRLPALGECVYAARGSGTWWQLGEKEPRRARVSPVSRLGDALLCFTDIEGFRKTDTTPQFDAMCRATRIARGWGDCYGHVLVATGRAEIALDPRMNPWDVAALIPLLEEAGGTCVGWSGDGSIHAGNAVSVNGALRGEVLRLLK